MKRQDETKKKAYSDKIEINRSKVYTIRDPIQLAYTFYPQKTANRKRAAFLAIFFEMKNAPKQRIESTDYIADKYGLSQSSITKVRAKMVRIGLIRKISFETLASKWLEVKEREVKKKSFNNLANYMQRAIKEWGNRNIKEINYPDIEDFLLAQKLKDTDKPVSDKTRANIRSALHNFWVWLRKRRVIKPNQMPEFPEVNFELRFRTTIDKDTQEAILDQIYDMVFHRNPKVWLGIRWLCIYISIRPGELIRIKEKHLDLKNGYIIIPHPKEKKPKLVLLLEDDIEIIKSFPRGLPELHFFRHANGSKFGDKYLYKYWKKATKSLGIEGVDLYGGTRHSSAIALIKFRTPEEIKRATMHSTNKAFERYFYIEGENLRDIYKDAQFNNEKKRGEVRKISFPVK